MRISIGITMSREMFKNRQHSCIFKTLCIHHGFSCNIHPVFPKRSEIDHRVIRIVIDICHWCKIYMDTHPAQLSANIKSHLVNKSFILNGPKHALLWVNNGTVKAHTKSPLCVHCNEQGGFGFLLKQVCNFSLAHRTSFKKNNTSDIKFLYQVQKGLRIIHFSRRIPIHHDQLCNLFIKIEGIHNRINPRGIRSENNRTLPDKGIKIFKTTQVRTFRT